MHGTQIPSKDERSKYKRTKRAPFVLLTFAYVLTVVLMFYATGANINHVKSLHQLCFQPAESVPEPQLHFHPPGRFAVPPLWKDANVRRLPFQFPAHRTERRNRAFVSSLPINTTEGLGHRFAMINMDLYIATKLNVGYIHRVSRYGTLSPDHDPKAVERMLGWLLWNDTRDEVMQTECHEYTIEPSAEKCRGVEKMQHVCWQLRKDSEFNQLVHIPTHMVDCLLSKSTPRQVCIDALAKFAEQHNESDTLFQMQPSTEWCAGDHRFGQFEETAAWFREQYWQFHRNTTLLDGEYVHDSMMVRGFTTLHNEHVTRILPFNEHRVQIAVHVRRGDFFNYTNRVMVPDTAYADAVACTKRAIDHVFGDDIGITVSIFSEGVVSSGRYRSMHDIGKMQSVYLTHNGSTVHDVDEHWKELIRTRLKDGADIRVQSFIATSTVEAVHTMITADVFIGSLSGLSAQIAHTLSRGVVMMPHRVGDDGRLGPSKSMNLRFNFGDHMQTHVDEAVLRKSVQAILEEHVRNGVIRIKKQGWPR